MCEHHQSPLDKPAMLLALCPPETAPFLQFWQTVYHWGWDPDCCPIVPRPFTDLLAQYNATDMCGSTQLQLLARFYGTTLVAPMDLDHHRAKDARADIEELIVAAISTGLELHEGSTGTTPLQLVLRQCIHRWYFCDVQPSTKGLNQVLLAWLKLLQRAGLDLHEYGKEEDRLCNVRRLAGDPMAFMPILASDAEAVHSAFELQFTYGPRPSDWAVWLSDFAEECSGDFWHMVGKQIEEASFDKYVLPGGWVSV